MNEARNLRALSSAQTPLLGGDNPELTASGGTGFVGATPQRSVAQTPNPLMTPIRGKNGVIPSATEQTPLRTPMRDSLKINENGADGFVGQTPREEKMRMQQLKKSLKSSLAGLPRPKNEYEIRLPDMDDESQEIDQKVPITPDMADVDVQEKESHEREGIYNLQCIDNVAVYLTPHIECRTRPPTPPISSCSEEFATPD